MLRHERAIGDTLSKFAIQLTREGVPVNLTGYTVAFTMSSLNGTVKVPESPATISNPTIGFVEYDFSTTDVDTKGFYKGFFRVYGIGEPDTYPADDAGIEIEIFDPAEPIIIDTGIPPDTFKDLAMAPTRTRTVEGTIEERSVDELIKADRYMRTSHLNSPPWGIRIARTKPPGTCS